MRKKGKIITGIVLFFVFIIIVVDFILGAFLIPFNYNNFRTRHPVYHHAIEKQTSSVAAWGPLRYRFFSNSLGFRDFKPRKIEIEKEKKRILLMGDSHTEGVGVDYQFTFGGRLQALAEKKNIEVLNAAAVSYSPKIHYLKGDYLLNNVGLEVDEIWVFVDISDLQNELAYEAYEPLYGMLPKIRINLQRFFVRHSFIYYSINKIFSQKELQIFTKALSNFNDTSSDVNSNTLEIYHEFFSDFDDQTLLQNPNFHGVSEWFYDPDFIPLAKRGIELGATNIKKLNKMCKEKDIDLKLSVHPWQKQLIKGDTSDFYVESWRKFCDQEDIGFINLYPVFINGENPYLVSYSCYITNDNHWNETGHKRVFDFLVSYLNEE